jgi:hypothetical protein
VLVNAVARELHAPSGNRFFVVIFGFDLVVLADFRSWSAALSPCAGAAISTSG